MSETQKPFRRLQDWMTFEQWEVDGLSDDAWEHYEKRGCLCAAHSRGECCCGAWWE